MDFKAVGDTMLGTHCAHHKGMPGTVDEKACKSITSPEWHGAGSCCRGVGTVDGGDSMQARLVSIGEYSGSHGSGQQFPITLHNSTSTALASALPSSLSTLIACPRYSAALKLLPKRCIKTACMGAGMLHHIKVNAWSLMTESHHVDKAQCIG